MVSIVFSLKKAVRFETYSAGRDIGKKAMEATMTCQRVMTDAACPQIENAAVDFPSSWTR